MTSVEQQMAVSLVRRTWEHVEAWQMPEGFVIISAETTTPNLVVTMYRVELDGRRSTVTDPLNMSHYLIDAEKYGRAL